MVAISPKLQVVQASDWQTQFAEWLLDRSAATRAAYLRDLNHFCAWFDQANRQAFEPTLMNSTDARQYREWCLGVERCAPSTWNRRRATLAVLCAWIEEQGITLFPFEKRIKRAEEQDLAPRWLTQPEERALMRQVEININAATTSLRRWRAVRDRALVAVLRYAGLRVEEAAELQLEDVRISERKGALTVRRGKRDKTRVVPLSTSAREALTDWLAQRGQAAGPVFTDENGASISTRAIQKRIEALASQCGIDGLTCHALRHTCAKSMVDAGRPLTEVQQVLGHEKLETTARYVQPGREDLEQAVEAGELGRMARLGVKNG